MKERLLLLSFSSLLAASSGIHSQPTNESNTKDTGNITQAGQSETFVSVPEPERSVENPPLMLANVSNIPDDQILDSEVFRVKEKSLPETTKITDATAIDKQADQEQASLNPITQDTVISQPATKKFSDEEIAQQRQLFLQAENSLKKNDDAAYFLLADQLKDYPLYPYIQYQWLKKNLDQDKQVKHFLDAHSSSRYTIKLKYKWLHYLGKNRQWQTIIQNPITTSDATLNCYYHRAQFNTGNSRAALYGARDLWTVGRSQPRACDPLFSQLQKSDLFTQELRWQRFDAALKNNKVSLAAYVRNMMSKEQQATAQLWLNLHRDPARYLPQLLSRTPDTQTPLMFRHAIDRLAGKDITAAIELWDDNKQDFDIAKDSADKLEKRLAMKLAFERDTSAYERFSQLDDNDSNSRTWRVRAALSEQNWQNVNDAIDALNEAEQQQEKWQYWQARAYLETGETDKAEGLLSELSENRSYYGYLAADKVNSLYQLSDNPVDVTVEQIDLLKDQKEFRVAFELMVLERKNEAKLQWWHAIRPLDKRQIIIAAKLAQRWQWDEIAIFTIAKAKHWDDVEMRFPLSYADDIHENSTQNNLNPALIFGLVRRESAFNEKAYSPAGARGLMQIMPNTGRQIARNLNERWRGSNSLYNPEMNIKYGSYYYQKLLNQFDGHYALALAAYNAGPTRVKQWLPEDSTVPADIWIETIPFRETRDYVSTVLAYALIYQQRTQSNDLSMNDFTRDIEPLDSGS